MPPKPTPNPRADSDRERDDILRALYDKLAAADPAWANSLSQKLKDQIARRLGR